MNTPRHSRNPRRGALLFEALGSLVMLSVLLGLIAQMVVKLDQQAGLRANRQHASLTLQNLMERAVARPWDEITRASLAQLAIPEEAAGRLTDAMLTSRVTEETDPVQSKRVTLSLAWSPTPGAEPRSVTLTTFVFASPPDKESAEEEGPVEEGGEP